MQLQTVAFSLPDAIVDGAKGIDVFQILTDKLNTYFSPKQNSTFERHLLRSLAPLENEDFSKFVLFCGYANKCVNAHLKNLKPR